MGRPPDTARRAELLAGATDYILDRGLGELSLRLLSEALGTSPRMLVHHFESKERLIGEALAEARRRQRTLLEGFLTSSPPTAPEEAVDFMWRFMSSPEAEPFMRLFFEVYGLALQHPDRFPGFLDHAVGDWVELIRSLLSSSGLSKSDAEEGATEGIALLRGLLLDLLATGDRDRVHAAYRNGAASLKHRAQALRQPR